MGNTRSSITLSGRAMLLVFGVTAQLAGAPQQAAAQDGLVLEEIIVTARKRLETIQDAPIAVSAMSGDELAKEGVHNLSDLRTVIPNVDVYDGSGTSGVASVFVRGVGARNTGVGFDSGVGIYYDGIYLSRADGALLDSLDLQSVQVLRGPQGTLFGKNSTGGAILYTSNRPQSVYEGAIYLRVGSFDRRDAKIMVNAPIIDEVLMTRLALASTKRDGYVTNLVDGGELNDQERLSGVFQLRWVPQDNMIVDLNINGSKTNQGARGQKCIPLGGLVPGAGWQSALQDGFIVNTTGKTIQENCQESFELDIDKILANEIPQRYIAETAGVNLSWEWELNDELTFKTLSSWRNTKGGQVDDLDSMSVSLVARSNFGHSFRKLRDTEQYSQEFQLNGSALDEALALVTGVFFFQEKTTGGIYAGVLGPSLLGPNPDADSLILFNSDAHELTTDNWASAAYGQLDWDFADSWRLTLGLRFTSESRELEHAVYLPDPQTLSSGEVQVLDSTTGLFILADGFDSLKRTDFDYQFVDTKRGKVDNSDWTPMASLQYRFEELGLINRGSVFVTYSEGFLSGGLAENRDLVTGGVPEYKAETVNNYEIGFKMDALDYRLRVNTAVFYMEYDDRQLTSLRVNPLTGNIAGTTINAKSSTIQGVEIETKYLVAANWALTVNLTFNEGDIKDYDDVRLVVPGSLDTVQDDCEGPLPPGVDVCPVDRSNENLVRLPEAIYYLAVEYNFNASFGTITPSISYSLREDVDNCFDYSSCVSGVYLNDQKDLSARLTWLSPEGFYRITAFGTNIENERYIVGGVPLTDLIETTGVVYSPPRMYGVELSARF